MVKYKWIALSNIFLGTLITNIDQSIVIIAIPSIGKDLHGVTSLDLIWVVIGYQLILASSLVNFGRLGDMFGRARLYKLGFAIFTIASALSSLSKTGGELVAFRMLQGVGAALLNSTSAAIVTDTFGVEERGRAFSIDNIAGSSGNVLGLVLGGVLTGTLGWRSIFWVNIPIGVFALLWGHFHLKELAKIDRSQKIDIAGNVIFLAAMIIILAGVTLFALSVFSLTTFIEISIIGASAMSFFFYVESKVDNPMLKLELFKIPSFALGNIAVFLNNVARGAITLVLALFLQGPTMNLNPFTAGLFILPFPAFFASFAYLGGLLSDRYGAKLLTTSGAIVTAVGCLVFSQFGAVFTFDQIAIASSIVGLGMGLFVSPNRASIMNSSPVNQRGISAGVYQTSTQVGNTVSRAFAFVMMGLVLSSTNMNEFFKGTLRITSSNLAGEIVLAMHLIFYTSAALLVIVAIISAVRVSSRNYGKNLSFNSGE